MKIDGPTCDRLGPCILLDVYENDEKVPDSYKKDWKNRCKDKNRYSCFVVFNNTDTNGNENTTANLDDSAKVDDGLKTTCTKDDRGLDGFKKCSIPVEFNNCFIDVRHNAIDGLNDYDIDNWRRLHNLYVVYEDNSPQLVCQDPINMALLMGSAGGAGMFLFIIGFLSYCIVINIRDRNQYKQFREFERSAWEDNDNVKGNKLHQEKSSLRQSIKNRLSRRVSFK